MKILKLLEELKSYEIDTETQQYGRYVRKFKIKLDLSDKLPNLFSRNIVSSVEEIIKKYSDQGKIEQQVRDAIIDIPGVEKVEIKVVLEDVPSDLVTVEDARKYLSNLLVTIYLTIFYRVDDAHQTVVDTTVIRIIKFLNKKPKVKYPN